jgi:hypothetical protein
LFFAQPQKGPGRQSSSGSLLEPPKDRARRLPAELLERNGFRERLEGSFARYQSVRADFCDDVGQNRICTFQVQHCNFHKR